MNSIEKRRKTSMDIAAFRKKLEERAKANRQAFEGRYRDEIEGLLGLSREEIDLITPDTTDLEIYDQLITVVKEASAANIAQAELKSRVMELGQVAILIAKQVPTLATLFA
jgi:methionine aminopeptidase